MSRLYAALYDRLNADHEAAIMRPRRQRLLATARGAVLELGAGTGANLHLYPAGLQLTLTEPDRHMLRRLRHRVRTSGSDATIVQAGAERLPLPDASVDTVVATQVFCTIADPDQALTEVRRVLRAGGQLLFLEHVRSMDVTTARRQDRLTPLTRAFAGGCHLNRDTLDTLHRAGFRPHTLECHPPAAPAERTQPFVQGAATPGTWVRTARAAGSWT